MSMYNDRSTECTLYTYNESLHVLQNDATMYTMSIIDGISWLDADNYCKTQNSSLWSVNSDSRWSSVYERFAFILNLVDVIFIGLQTYGKVSIYECTIQVIYMCMHVTFVSMAIILHIYIYIHIHIHVSARIYIYILVCFHCM